MADRGFEPRPDADLGLHRSPVTAAVAAAVRDEDHERGTRALSDADATHLTTAELWRRVIANAAPVHDHPIDRLEDREPDGSDGDRGESSLDPTPATTTVPLVSGRPEMRQVIGTCYRANDF